MRKANKQVILPSDFDNSLLEPIKDDSIDDFLDGIMAYFLQRQKTSIDVNKIYLISNRYLIKEKIKDEIKDYLE